MEEKLKTPTRDELVTLMRDHQAKEQAIREQIEEIDFVDKKAKLESYIGKCFIENELGDVTVYVRCLLVYGIDLERHTLRSICVDHWEDNEESHFAIEYMDHFNPTRFPEDDDNWKETTREEFDKHYQAVQNKIGQAILK